MVSNTLNSVVPIRALLAGIKVEGDLKRKRRHFVVISVDDEIVFKSEKKSGRHPRWKWEDKGFLFHPSSTIKVAVYRASRTRLDFAKHLVGQYTEKVIELLDNDAPISLKNKKGVEIASKFKIKTTLPLDPDFEDTFKSFMKIVDDDISRLKSAGQPSSAISVLSTFRKVFRLTKGIIDVVADAHPILKASWTVASAVYTAVKRAERLDDAVGRLAESLREMLGTAKELAVLSNLKIEGTTDVIEEIGRTSLKVASLIHEYTTTQSFLGRAARAQFFSDLETRTKQYQETCDDLTRKLDRRVIIQMSKAVHVTLPQGFQHRIVTVVPPPRDFQHHASPPQRDSRRHAAPPKRDSRHHAAPPQQDSRHHAPPQRDFQRNVTPPPQGFQHRIVTVVPSQRDFRRHAAPPPRDSQHHAAPPQRDFRHHAAPPQRDFQHHTAPPKRDFRHHAAPPKRETQRHAAPRRSREDSPPSSRDRYRDQIIVVRG